MNVARRDLIAPFILVAVKLLIGAYLLHIGFTHVSDDDYARVVIAETFAHAPKIDPSGTSWLPFPFWLNGAAMILFGRSLETARALAVVFGAINVVPVYFALRAAGVGRGVATTAVFAAMATPWNAWLGVATVPEALTGALIAAGAIALGSARARVWGALALWVAALSRYEAWPVCVVGIVVTAIALVRSPDSPRREWSAMSLCAAGPLSWLAWNAHAHGSAVHFLARVSAYRRAIGAAEIPLRDKLFGYPTAIVGAMPALLALGGIGVFALGDPTLRKRWRVPLFAMGAMLAFLVYGDVHDGAPTHHAERALIGAIWVVAGFGLDAAHTLTARFAWLRPQRESYVVGVAVAGAIAWGADTLATWRDYPGGSVDERRDAQIATGQKLRDAGGTAIDVVPCAYEHFALLAAFGSPERARIFPAVRDAGGVCPKVLVR